MLEGKKEGNMKAVSEIKKFKKEVSKKVSFRNSSLIIYVGVLNPFDFSLFKASSTHIWTTLNSRP